MKQAFSLRYSYSAMTQGVALGWYETGLRPGVTKREVRAKLRDEKHPCLLLEGEGQCD
jgi:hypothetical protein